MPVQHRLRNSSLFCFRLRSLDESTTEHHTTNNLPKCQAGAHSADFSRGGNTSLQIRQPFLPRSIAFFHINTSVYPETPPPPYPGPLPLIAPLADRTLRVRTWTPRAASLPTATAVLSSASAGTETTITPMRKYWRF